MSTELQRRAAADHDILRMEEGDAKSKAIAEEKEIRDRFEAKRLREDPLGFSNTPGASTRSSSSMATSKTSGQAQLLLSRDPPAPPAERGNSHLFNFHGMNLNSPEDWPEDW